MRQLHLSSTFPFVSVDSHESISPFRFTFHRCVSLSLFIVLQICLLGVFYSIVVDSKVGFVAWGLAALQAITPIVVQIFLERKLLTEMVAWGYAELAIFTIFLLGALRMVVYIVLFKSKIGLPVNFVHQYMRLDFSFMHENLEDIQLGNLFRDVALLVILIFYELVTGYQLAFVARQCFRYSDARKRRGKANQQLSNPMSSTNFLHMDTASVHSFSGPNGVAPCPAV